MGACGRFVWRVSLKWLEEQGESCGDVPVSRLWLWRKETVTYTRSNTKTYQQMITDVQQWLFGGQSFTAAQITNKLDDHSWTATCSAFLARLGHLNWLTKVATCFQLLKRCHHWFCVCTATTIVSIPDSRYASWLSFEPLLKFIASYLRKLHLNLWGYHTWPLLSVTCWKHKLLHCAIFWALHHIHTM
jgi:hypothetical protein